MPDESAVRQLWGQFHNVWGQARGGIYEKPEWMRLQALIERCVGLDPPNEPIEWRD